MTTKNLLVFLLILSSSLIMAQPGTVNMTPVTTYIGGLTNTKVYVPQKFRTELDTNRTISLPNNFKPSIFHMGGLSKPRVLEISPTGILHVIDYKVNGAVYALPDLNKDDIADTLLPVVTNVYAHDFKFYGGDIYVAEENRILQCKDLNQDGFYETKLTFIDSVGLRSNNPFGGHKTRSILFDDTNKKIYVSIGSSCNVCRDEDKAVIEQYNIDGSGRKVFATGIRNAVGMTIHPRTGKLWANNNGSDKIGNDIPPEWIDIINENTFYGFPFAYGNQVWFNMDAQADYTALKPITKTDSSMVAKMQEPAGLIQAHSAPMELEYIDLSNPPLKNTGFLMALRGSWNRKPATGYKLVWLQQFSDDKIGTVSDFVTGFLTDSINRAYWARPVGIAVEKKANGFTKNIYFSSDEGNAFVMLLKDMRPVGIQEQIDQSFKVFPNPFQQTIQIELNTKGILEVNLFDLMGRQQTIAYNTQNKVITTSALPDGIYILQVKTENGLYVKKMIHENK